MNIQVAIKKLRTELLLDQKEFAGLLGVSPGAVSHYETGDRKPRVKIIRKIVEIAKKNKIKISLEDFLT